MTEPFLHSNKAVVVGRLALIILLYTTVQSEGKVSNLRRELLQPPSKRFRISQGDLTLTPVSLAEGVYMSILFGIEEQVIQLGPGFSTLEEHSQYFGTIPTQIGQLSNLKYLTLKDNHLEGTIPTQIGLLTQLELLNVANQKNLFGKIPSELGKLTNLKRLYLNDNHIIGKMPTQLGNLVNLEALYVHDTPITGAIPTQLGKLANVKTLRLNSNLLSGKIPHSCVA